MKNKHLLKLLIILSNLLYFNLVMAQPPKQHNFDSQRPPNACLKRGYTQSNVGSLISSRNDSTLDVTLISINPCLVMNQAGYIADPTNSTGLVQTSLSSSSNGDFIMDWDANSCGNGSQYQSRALGQTNTTGIVANSGCALSSGAQNAARFCYCLVLNTNGTINGNPLTRSLSSCPGTWYLPSYGELGFGDSSCRTNGQTGTLCANSFPQAAYWSSTEYSSGSPTNALYWFFPFGFGINSGKTTAYAVRCYFVLQT